MSIDVHTVALLSGSQTVHLDRVLLGVLPGVANLAGNGDPASVAAGTIGAGYATIPTAAFANVGTGSGATLAALMGVVSATVNAGGSGGTNGTVTVTGTTGTGTKFQATGTIAGAALTGPLTVTVAGSYSALPSSLTAEAITGGSLTGATVGLSFGVVGFTVSAGSSNHQYQQGTTATLTGGTPTTAAVPGAVTVTPVAGQPVVVPVSMNLPTAYAVQVTPSQDAVAFVSGKTSTGFNVTLNPRLAANTVAAGTIDIVVTA